MTGYTVNTGSTTKFSEGWDRVFGGGQSAKKTASRSDAANTPKAAKKPAAGKTSRSAAKKRKTS